MRDTCYRRDGNNRGRQRTALTLAMRSLLCRFIVHDQYLPPSLVWSQLAILYGVILRTTRFGALETAPEGTAAVADSPARRIVS
jgi:hypothetical protein